MKKYIKYRGIKIRLVYCNYSFDYYVTKKYGVILLLVNKGYKDKKLLHKVVKNRRY